MNGEPRTQAKRIADKFGGVPGLCKALRALGPEHARDLSAIYRWDYPKSKGGAGGIVPSSAMPDVLRAARREGILIGPDETYPGVL